MHPALHSLSPASPIRVAVGLMLLALAGALVTREAVAQLAITEVLAAPSTSIVEDFWELTNFGTNSINLENYRFRDNGGPEDAAKLGELWAATRTDAPVIHPGETILFARRVTGLLATPEEFRQWWGETRLPADLKIIFYSGFGFNTGGDDSVQLWQVTGNRTSLVHRVELLPSTAGRSFTYDSLTGAVDAFSKAGVNGAFMAATTEDAGSPGFTTGPVPLRVGAGPAGGEVDGGAPFTFTVKAHGLPPPQYQWQFNGEPIPDATDSTFTLPAVDASDAGQYSVVLDNGLERTVAAPATITVNTQPSCIRIVRPPADLEMTPGQTAFFHVEVRGYPLATFQWQFNGVDIPGATSSTYAQVGAEETSIGTYTVRVTNPLCSTNASAHLNVVPAAKLMVTEAMTNPNNRDALRHDSWWELTNVDTDAVNLRGYRWDDFPASLVRTVTVTNDIILEPGKSAIFVSSMSPEAFLRWWGEENLPAGLPIISHSGNGLSSQNVEVIYVWNATATDIDDWICFVDFLHLEAGRSLWFDKAECEYGCPSTEGGRGAFAAAEGGDIGSPGWTSNEQRVVRPRVTRIQRLSTNVTVTWKTQPGRTYELRRSSTPGGVNWPLVARLSAAGSSLSATDPAPAGTSQRFYQVILVP